MQELYSHSKACSSKECSLPYTSLVPRPSHCQVFDCLQYAKMKGKGLHDPFYHVNDVIIYLGRWGEGVQIEKQDLDSCSFCPKRWSFERS